MLLRFEKRFPSRLRGNKTGGEVGILTQGMSADYEVIRWFPKIRGTSLGVPITRIMIFMRLYWGPRLFRETIIPLLQVGRMLVGAEKISSYELDVAGI